MEQKSGGGAVGISDFRDHETAVRSKRVEQPDGSADSATGADDTFGRCSRSRTGQIFISYFRWRTCTFGTEMYWHGILDYSGRENRRFREVKEIHRRLEKMKDVAGSHYEAQVGILRDYDNIWDAQLDRWHQRVEEASRQAFFEAAQKSHTPVDYVYLDHANPEKLKQYKVLIYPHMVIATKEQAECLAQYVEAGGILVIGCRSGYKDVNGKCVMEKLPGVLSELTGTDISEYSMIAPDTGKVTIDWGGTELEANVFADLLKPVHGGFLEGTYTADYYAGSGAVTSRKWEKENIYMDPHGMRTRQKSSGKTGGKNTIQRIDRSTGVL